MTLEDLFTKEFEALKDQVRELEKENRLLEMQNRDQVKIIEEAKELIRDLNPEFVNEALCLNTRFYYNTEKTIVLRLLAKLGITNIKGGNQ